MLECQHLRIHLGTLPPRKNGLDDCGREKRQLDHAGDIGGAAVLAFRQRGYVELAFLQLRPTAKRLAAAAIIRITSELSIGRA